MAARLSDMLELFLHAERNTSYLMRINVTSTLDRARALADIVNLRPELLNDQEELQGICNRLGAERIAVSDENGTIVAAVPASEVGNNLAQREETMPFLDCVAAPGFELSLRTTSSDAGQQTMQHAAVHRLDRPGVVILTFRMRVEQEARESESLSYLTSNLKLGSSGQIFVFRRGAMVAGDTSASVSQAALLALPTNRALEISIDGRGYYAYAVENDGYRLVGAVPKRRVYHVTLSNVWSLMLSNILLFGVMFCVVCYLLQRLVVRNISRVNESLHEITEGNLDKRVEVDNVPEFARLSNGINFMVESIKALGEEKSQSLNRDLELARTMQSTVMPSRFPAFPNIKEFDLHATCLPAQIVGGDFYDFFLSDDGKRLSFLVADVDVSGVAAALFMMRAMSIIRTLGKAGETPVDIVTQLNRELCRRNGAGICMALFMGALEIESGVLHYVNAGGMHVLLQRADEPYEMMPCYTSAMIGENEGTQFHTSSMTMGPEDRIFLYTEGVIYAANASNTPFGEGRLQEALRGTAPTAADEIQLVRAALRQHCGSSELQRDVTMLCLEYRGALGNMVSMTLTASEAEQADEFLTEKLESLFVAPVEIEDMQNALRGLLSVLPPGLLLSMYMDCTEERGSVTLAWQSDELNPLELLAPLPVDSAVHEFTAEGGNKVTIYKKFA